MSADRIAQRRKLCKRRSRKRCRRAVLEWLELRLMLQAHQFSVDDVTVEEGWFATFTVELASAPTEPVTLQYRTEDDSAMRSDAAIGGDWGESGVDFYHESGTLTFASGETEKQIAVQTAPDGNGEPDEYFRLVVSESTGTEPQVVSARATIYESTWNPRLEPGDQLDESAPVVLSPGQAITFLEYIGDRENFAEDVDLYRVSLIQGHTLSLDIDAHYRDGGLLNHPGGPPESPFDSYLRVFDAAGNEVAANDDAVHPSDYFRATLDPYISFTAASTGTYYVGVSAADNTTYNPHQKSTTQSYSTGGYWLTLTLQHTGGQGGISGGTHDYRDGGDDRIIKVEGGKSLEGHQVKFTLTRTSLLDETTTVAYATRERSATGTAECVDYCPASGTVTFFPTERSKEIYVDTARDHLREPLEQFFLDVTTPWGDKPIAVGTVQDNQQPRIAVTDVVVKEGQYAEVHADIFWSEALIQPFELTYSSYSWSATNADYVDVSGTITVVPGESRETIRILTRPDRIREQVEDLFLQFATPWGDRRVSQIMIEDDVANIPNVQFGRGSRDGLSESQKVLSIAEGGVVTVGLELDRPLEEPIAISYRTHDGSAANTDYQQQSGTITFGAGETWKTLSIQTLRDWQLEQTEQFFVEVTDPWNHHDVMAVKLNDESLPELHIDNVTVVNGTTAVFTVTLGHAAGREVTVDYQTVDGTAEGLCGYYCDASGQLVFAAGEVQKTISVDTVQHVLPEDEEFYGMDDMDFFVDVSSAWGAFARGRGVITYGGNVEDPGEEIIAVADAITLPHNIHVRNQRQRPQQ